MYDYSSAFASAHRFSSMRMGTELNPSFPLSDGSKLQVADLAPVLARVLAHHFETVESTDGHCLFATMIMSLCLCGQEVPHAITIGDVEYDNGTRYTKDSEESLLEDVKKGFVVKFVDGVPSLEPANVHSWITLQNGQILDPTISPHIDVIREVRSLTTKDFKKAIFGIGHPDPRVAKHIPMLTGLNYHMQVATGFNHLLGIKEQNFDIYQKWRKLYLSFMR